MLIEELAVFTALLALYTLLHVLQPHLSWRDIELYENQFGQHLCAEIELDLSTTPL